MEGVQQPAPSGYDESYLRQHEEARNRERAITSLQPGQKIAVYMPGRGNVLFTRRLQDEAYQAGDETLYRPVYDQIDLTPQPAAEPIPPTERTQPLRPANPKPTSLPPAHIGPVAGVDFGPQGLQPQEAIPYSQLPSYDTRGKQPPESHPDAKPDYEPTFVDNNDDLSDIDEAFARPLVSRRTNRNPESQPESVLVHKPGDKRGNPRPQAGPEWDSKQSTDLVDQIKRGEALPVAEVPEGEHPDMTAVRKSKTQPGVAAALEHAEKIGAAGQSDEAKQRPRPAADEEAPRNLDDLFPGVVPEGQESPDVGGDPPRYRR